MMTGMKTVNSERDLSLPLEKHKALEKYYESQEDGEFFFFLLLNNIVIFLVVV